MPTIGPSVLFVAGLTLGVATGYWSGREQPKAVPAGVPFPPPPEHAGQDVKRVQIPIAGGSVVLAGGNPGV